MKVWIAIWENRPPQVFETRRVLAQAIADDMLSGYFENSDIEYSDTSIFIDEWLDAKEVNIIHDTMDS